MSKLEHQDYYGGDGTYECINVLKAWQLDKCFYLGNVLKYICRAGKKHSDLLSDLEKAKNYLQYKIDQLKSEEDPNTVNRWDLAEDHVYWISAKFTEVWPNFDVEAKFKAWLYDVLLNNKTDFELFKTPFKDYLIKPTDTKTQLYHNLYQDVTLLNDVTTSIHKALKEIDSKLRTTGTA